MRRFAGACRYVFNQALALQKANYEGGGKFIGYVAMAKRLTEWRNGSETPWLKEAPVHPLQHALKDLERAYQNFFAKGAVRRRHVRAPVSDSAAMDRSFQGFAELRIGNGQHPRYALR
jgi:putative transposase